MVELKKKNTTISEVNEVVMGIPYKEKIEIKTTSRDLTLGVFALLVDWLKATHNWNSIVKSGVAPEPDKDGNWTAIFYVFGPEAEGKFWNPRTTY